jgi:hypothetical protein
MAETAEAPKYDVKLVNVLARTLSGLELSQWQELDKEAKRVHTKMAKRVLNTIERYNAQA